MDAIAGLGKSLYHENNRIRIKNIVFTQMDAERQIDCLMHEIHHYDGPGHVRYSGQLRFVHGFEPALIDWNLSNEYLKEGGTYLITGGMGGLGVLFARYLSEQRAMHIILAGRSPSCRHSWQRLNR